MAASEAVTMTDKERESRRMDLILPNKRLVIIMVGLPARGKSYMGKKIFRYLLHLNLNARIINLGSYRRNKTKDITVGQASAKFFDPKNSENRKLRDQICIEGLTDLLDWFHQGGQVGIFDATNVSLSRRKLIRSFLQQQAPVCQFDIDTLYVESICNDNKVIESNIISAKLKNPDYCTVERETAIRDFWERIKMYESDYNKVEAHEGPYVKVIDVGNDIVGHSIHNYISLRILYFLMHLNLHRTIFSSDIYANEPVVSRLSKTKPKPIDIESTKAIESHEKYVPLNPLMRRSSFLLWNDPGGHTPKVPIVSRVTSNKEIIPPDIDLDANESKNLPKHATALETIPSQEPSELRTIPTLPTVSAVSASLPPRALSSGSSGTSPKSPNKKNKRNSKQNKQNKGKPEMKMKSVNNINIFEADAQAEVEAQAMRQARAEVSRETSEFLRGRIMSAGALDSKGQSSSLTPVSARHKARPSVTRTSTVMNLIRTRFQSVDTTLDDGNESDIGTDDEEDDEIYANKSLSKVKKMGQAEKDRMRRSLSKKKVFNKSSSNHNHDDESNRESDNDNENAEPSQKSDGVSSFVMDSLSMFTTCSIVSCGRVFDDNNPKYLCGLCNRVVCGNCSQKVPAKDHAHIKIRICDICLFETDSSGEEADATFSTLTNEEESSLVKAEPPINVELVEEPLTNGINSIESLLDNLQHESKENIKVELVQLSQQLRKIVNSLKQPQSATEV